jgi:uncharacterized protein (DUF362 family)
MNTNSSPSRREFLRASTLATVGALMGARCLPALAGDPAGDKARTAVSLTTGTDRADLVFQGLKRFEKQLAQAIGKKRVLIKPNNVAIDNPLCATHADAIQGILEFLKSIKKVDQAVIAESAASGPTLEGFSNYGYTRLAAKYPIKLLDLDTQGIEVLHVFDEKDFRPHPVRMSRALLDPDTFVISATRLKTHDRVVATLSLKNIVFGAPIKDAGFRWSGGRAGAQNDKPIAHGSGFRGINFNLFTLAARLHPHLSVLDGVEGMQGNGPVGGSPVDHRVVVVSPDWLAADRTGVELMGIDFKNVGYLNFCAQAGMGEANLDHIEILGPRLVDHVKAYRLNDNIKEQLVWRQPAAAA